MVLTFCLLLAAATANQREELSLMGPKDVAYTEAMQFAESLQRHGIAVQSIHRSKMEGFFKGLNKAAFIRTDKGVVEVIFLTTRQARKRFWYWNSGKVKDTSMHFKVSRSHNQESVSRQGIQSILLVTKIGSWL